MNDRKIMYYRAALLAALFLTLCAMGLVYRFYIVKQIPDTIHIRKGKEENISFEVPVSARVTKGTQEEIAIPVSTSVSIVAGDAQSYEMHLKYLGMIPMKSVHLDIVSDQAVAVCGMPIGIYLKTQGVLVIDTGAFEVPGSPAGEKTERYENETCPAEGILQPGDYILAIDGIDIESKKQFVELVENSSGDERIFTILRNGELSNVKIKPVLSKEQVYKIGVWVRDSAQGIGTLTYLTGDGKFGALGHGINDSDIGMLMELKKGSIYDTNILSVSRAQENRPGELTGVLSFEENDYIGQIEQNTKKGIYGTISETYLTGRQGEQMLSDCRILPVALKQEVTCGDAQIYCKIGEEAKLYDAKITELDYNAEKTNRGIMLTITDEELLRVTGGIVQGMSGSPILQNGKIVGAVTHVLVNDPTRGYGIFIEEMLEAGDGG